MVKPLNDADVLQSVFLLLRTIIINLFELSTQRENSRRFWNMFSFYCVPRIEHNDICSKKTWLRINEKLIYIFSKNFCTFHSFCFCKRLPNLMIYTTNKMAISVFFENVRNKCLSFWKAHLKWPKIIKSQFEAILMNNKVMPNHLKVA